MSAIDIAVSGSKKIEAVLVGHFGAVGRGLHEKLTSVEGRIPFRLQKQIRYVASVRNSVVHESGENQMRDPVGFEATVARILSELKQISNWQSQASPEDTPKKAPGGVMKGSPKNAAGGLMWVVCDKVAAPWIFLIGGAVGFFVGECHGIGIVFSVVLGLVIGALAAVFSRVVYVAMSLGVILFFIIAFWEMFAGK